MVVVCGVSSDPQCHIGALVEAIVDQKIIAMEVDTPDVYCNPRPCRLELSVSLRSTLFEQFLAGEFINKSSRLQ
ncbi:hypothetical protein SUGI_0556070 [Cryptomeria japonica]|nr:hypothetical protein SUGI_0556070 [Cryptomeria japonica]